MLKHFKCLTSHFHCLNILIFNIDRTDDINPCQAKTSKILSFQFYILNKPFWPISDCEMMIVSVTSLTKIYRVFGKQRNRTADTSNIDHHVTSSLLELKSFANSTSIDTVKGGRANFDLWSCKIVDEVEEVGILAAELYSLQIVRRDKPHTNECFVPCARVTVVGANPAKPTHIWIQPFL